MSMGQAVQPSAQPRLEPPPGRGGGQTAGAHIMPMRMLTCGSCREPPSHASPPASHQAWRLQRQCTPAGCAAAVTAHRWNAQHGPNRPTRAC